MEDGRAAPGASANAARFDGNSGCLSATRTFGGAGAPGSYLHLIQNC